MPGDFPTRLRELREKQRKSRRVVSELCGLHPNAVRRYELGESQPTLESLAALADYFHVSVDYLIGRAAGG